MPDTWTIYRVTTSKTFNSALLIQNTNAVSTLVEDPDANVESTVVDFRDLAALFEARGLPQRYLNLNKQDARVRLLVRMSVEPESLRKIGRGTLISATTGALVGSAIALFKRGPLLRHSLSTSLNFSIFGALFLSIRETFLLSQRKHNPQLGLNKSQTRDYDELISSTLAGGITGGFLSSITRGPTYALRGTVGFSVICGCGQTLYTFLYRYRQRLILESMSSSDLRVNPTQPEPEHQVGGTIVDRMFDQLSRLKWTPVRKLSDEEYEALLRKKLETIDKELEIYEIKEKMTVKGDNIRE